MERKSVLPSSTNVRRVDRFGLVDSDDYASAPILDVSSLAEALETIAVTLRGIASGTDFSLLREFMARRVTYESASDFFLDIWPVIVDLALEMPALFPEGALPSLSPTQEDCCLVVHQFLCSLPSHLWSTESFVDLRPWYSVTSAVHRGAVDAYLTALFTYFERICDSAEGQKSILDFEPEEWPILFSMQKNDRRTSPPLLGLPDGACVISANKCVGYGRSGTQEELNVGATPEAYPVVLLAPALSDNQVLICRGAEAMVSIIGYGRDAKLGKDFRSQVSKDHGTILWKNRTMLFMDALELDTLPVEGDSLIPDPDIYPSSHLSRDMILKAYNWFSSDTYSHIVTGLWGCGTFGGNRYVKCILQWCAAALAGVPELRFVLSTTEQHRLGESLLMKQMCDILITLKDKIHDVGRDGIFTYVANEASLYDHS
ncbi:uncharacterized protein BJX67DRAFT_345491 [Aspergillus lucknowensis]|uniref:poly(ADP-ribose) glycohydrolase n=1 Tax=Aspergillus lucknowensis TaxID=176173 RepID=A0ABR4M2W8_9EURO